MTLNLWMGNITLSHLSTRYVWSRQSSEWTLSSSLIFHVSFTKVWAHSAAVSCLCILDIHNPCTATKTVTLCLLQVWPLFWANQNSYMTVTHLIHLSWNNWLLSECSKHVCRAARRISQLASTQGEKSVFAILAKHTFTSSRDGSYNIPREMMRLLSNMLSNQWNLKASQTFRNSSRNRWVGSARSENPSASFTQLSSKLLTGEHDAINWQLSPCVLSKVQFGKTKTSMQPVCGWIAPMLLLLSHVSSPQDLMAFPAFAPLGAPPYYILSHIMSSAGVILDSSSIRSPPAATAKLCARHWQRCFVRESPLTRAGSEVHSELSSLDLMLVHIRAAGQLRSRARHPLNLSKDRGFYTPWLSSLFTAKSRRKKRKHRHMAGGILYSWLYFFQFFPFVWKTGGPAPTLPFRYFEPRRWSLIRFIHLIYSVIWILTFIPLFSQLQQRDRQKWQQ